MGACQSGPTPEELERNSEFHPKEVEEEQTNEEKPASSKNQ